MRRNDNYISATEARKEWSRLLDGVIREKPQFLSRTRDRILISDINLMRDILTAYTFTAKIYNEDDESFTLSLNEIDLSVNGKTEVLAKRDLANSILEYANDFYSDFVHWSSAPNRKKNIPYVLKALILEDIDKIEESISII